MPPADVYRMRLRRYCLATYQPFSSSGDGGGGGDTGRGKEGGAGPHTEQLPGGAAVALQPVLDPAGQQVLWSSVQPEADTPAAAMAYRSSCGISSRGGSARSGR